MERSTCIKMIWILFILNYLHKTDIRFENSFTTKIWDSKTAQLALLITRASSEPRDQNLGRGRILSSFWRFSLRSEFKINKLLSSVSTVNRVPCHLLSIYWETSCWRPIRKGPVGVSEKPIIRIKKRPYYELLWTASYVYLGCCEHWIESAGSLEGWEFLEWLLAYQGIKLLFHSKK
jgi:hypothetical protein